MKENWKYKKAYVATLLFALALSGCTSGGGNQIKHTEESSQETKITSGQKETEAISDKTTSGQTEETSKTVFSTGRMGDDYILPDAAEHTYTAKEVSVLTAEELRIARNEIYARHGRKFKSDDLIQYFTGKSWYHGSIEPDAFDESLLNPNEVANLKLVKQAETAMSVCSAPKIGRDEFPVIDGSTATLPLSQALYRLSTGASVQEAEKTVTHHKTTDAWLSLYGDEYSWYGRSDLVIAYEPGGMVQEALDASGEKPLIKPIGRDALIFLSNRSNPVISLTQGQISGIYSGTITNWKELGGQNRKIKAFQRPADSGSQNLMEKLVMKGKQMADAPMDLVSSEMGELMEKVSAYDNTGDAIGYSVYYYARNMYQKPELTFMAVDGVVPSGDTIRDGSYPYVNDFYAAIRSDEPRDSKAYQLYEWLTSEDGQSLINGLGYVGIGAGVKELPKGFFETEEELKASIGLPDGFVLLASGMKMYGEYGIGIYDSHMRLLQFINHVESWKVDPFLVCKKDAEIPMMDTATGQYKYYSIGKKKWLDRAYNDDDSEELYRLADTFSDNHPELLEKYGVTEDAVYSQYLWDSLPPIIVITDGNINHYYDVYGNHMLDYDTAGKPDEEYYYVNVLDEHMAYLFLRDKETDKMRFLLYRDGAIIKELVSDDSGEIDSINPYFYTRTNGNYLYFYNERDELCAKFLTGYLRND